MLVPFEGSPNEADGCLSRARTASSINAVTRTKPFTALLRTAAVTARKAECRRPPDRAPVVCFRVRAWWVWRIHVLRTAIIRKYRNRFVAGGFITSLTESLSRWRLCRFHDQLFHSVEVYTYSVSSNSQLDVLPPRGVKTNETARLFDETTPSLDKRVYDAFRCRLWLHDWHRFKLLFEKTDRTRDLFEL